MQTTTRPATSAPAIAAVVTHDVEDFDRWRKAFDAHAAARRDAGIVATHVNRHADEPNRLSVYLAGSDAAKLQAFLTSTDLAATMRGAGVKGPPHVALVTPAEDMTVKDRSLPAVIIQHEVKDYAAWKVAFDRHGEARAEAGIIGHAVNRSVASPNVVVVYLQAESADALRAFTSSPDLKETMQAAGVVGAPSKSFVTGGTFEV